MLFTAFGWLLVLACACMMFFVSLLYFWARTLSNQILAVASKDFHEASNSMLDTPEDIPDSILDVLSKMDRTAQRRGASSMLASAMAQGNESKMAQLSRDRIDFQQDFEKMRPELQDLFHKAVAGWFNYLSHQNVVDNLRINFAIMRMKPQGLDTSRAEETAGFSFLKGINNGAC